MKNKYPCIECQTGWGDSNGNSCQGSCNKLATYRKLYMTNGNYIRSMNDKELANFILLVTCNDTPWGKAFYEYACKNCPTITGTPEGSNEPNEFHEYDFVDGECPYGDDVTWWLKQPVNDNNVCNNFGG